ncbi:MAG: VOC family protein [Oscillospiraceae bacterium]|jgi:catechol 2,3-dioxygenase-like lactoylglutathione lyase family enzyme|nr:VOC family protein [Oscillospiraceae bacterium]
MGEATAQGGSVKPVLVAVNIVSSDPERTADFYRDVLGAVIIEDRGGPDRIEIRFGDPGDDSVFIVVNRDEGFAPQPFNACQGFEFRVADVDAEYARITALGVEVKEPPKSLPWGYRFFHIKDPDGNGVDITARL